MPMAAGLDGCSAAPSYTAFGAYFPAWLICVAAGVAAAVAAKVALSATGLWEATPLKLPVCLAVGVIVGGLLSWAWIGT